MAQLDLMTLVVPDYDSAIAFFVDVLDFELAEDSPSLANDGTPKRWVVVRPRGASGSEQTGLLLAQAVGETQQAAIGQQFGGRVGLFLRVDDFEQSFLKLRAAGVEFVNQPRTEGYGRVVVFRDPWGNKWDLLGPRPG